MREWLSIARKDKGLTQKALAEMVGLGETSISKYEVGKRSPSFESAKKIGQILEFSWTKFYE